ncbi:MAG: hypothetical protein WCJ09_05660 [Planctomycetota bacterium]
MFATHSVVGAITTNESACGGETMISGETENQLKQTGLFELWGLGFIVGFASIYGMFLGYGCHFSPQLCPSRIVTVTASHAVYAAIGTLCVFFPSRDEYVPKRRRALFASVHCGFCFASYFLYFFVACPK